MSTRVWPAAVLVLVGTLLATPGAASAQAGRDLAELSLEELANLEVTSVRKQTELLAQAPAAVFVITAEDLRRSGVTTLTEALRLAPNLHVARINNYEYAISARGFNSTTANKLQVLIDGRSVYTPLFSGVFWDVQEVPLTEVERIEVISGPGSTIWGSNAVSGVVNVVTQHASRSQGGLVGIEQGSHSDKLIGRWGTTLGEGHWRLYAKHVDEEHSELAIGGAQRDAWERIQAGFRADWNGAEQDLSIRGDLYHAHFQQRLPGRREASGSNLLVNWQRQLDRGGRLQLHGSLDHRSREHPGTFAHATNIAEFEWQYLAPPQDRHHLVYGGNYRVSWDRIENSAVLSFLPDRRRLHWAGVYVEDAITLTPQTQLTLGLRGEHNAYTGVEWMPQLRLAHQLPLDRLVWLSLSRAVRTPSRVDRDFHLREPFVLDGGPGFRSEIAHTLELGYRINDGSRWQFAITAFFNDYRDLRSLEPSAGGNLVIANKSEGESSGIEAWARWQVDPNWRLTAGYAYLDQRLRPTATSRDPFGIRLLGNNPHQRLVLRSSWQIGHASEFDLQLRAVSNLPDPVVPGYGVVDARYGWRPRPSLELSLAIQNLFDHAHAEFGNPLLRSEFDRHIRLELRWEF